MDIMGCSMATTSRILSTIMSSTSSVAISMQLMLLILSLLWHQDLPGVQLSIASEIECCYSLGKLRWLTCKRCVAYREHIVINIAQTLIELGECCAGTWTLHLFCNLHSSILFLFLRMRTQYLYLQMGSLPKRHSQTAGMTSPNV